MSNIHTMRVFISYFPGFESLQFRAAVACGLLHTEIISGSLPHTAGCPVPLSLHLPHCLSVTGHHRLPTTAGACGIIVYTCPCPCSAHFCNQENVLCKLDCMIFSLYMHVPQVCAIPWFSMNVHKNPARIKQLLSLGVGNCPV